MKILHIAITLFFLFFPRLVFSQDWAEQLIENATEHFEEYVNLAISEAEGDNPAVRFISVCLRKHPDTTRNFPNLYASVTEGPAEPDEPCEIQLRCALEKRNFSAPCFDASLLKKGDIVFTEDRSPYQNKLWPTHAYIFIEWEKPDSYDYAYIMDYRGAYERRNITVEGNFVKFQYFLRSPYAAATAIADEALKIEENERKYQLNVWSVLLGKTLNIKAKCPAGSTITVLFSDLSGRKIDRWESICSSKQTQTYKITPNVQKNSLLFYTIFVKDKNNKLIGQKSGKIISMAH